MTLFVGWRLRRTVGVGAAKPRLLRFRLSHCFLRLPQQLADLRADLDVAVGDAGLGPALGRLQQPAGELGPLDPILRHVI